VNPTASKLRLQPNHLYKHFFFKPPTKPLFPLNNSNPASVKQPKTTNQPATTTRRTTVTQTQTQTDNTAIMDKVKDKLHIGSKRKEEKAAALAAEEHGDQGTSYGAALLFLSLSQSPDQFPDLFPLWRSSKSTGQ
jgi:hypothetical protein